MGDHPQAIINRQIVDKSDILVGVFWTRLGTPTESAESGTAEEIQQFVEDEKPVLLYFSSRPVDLDSINLTEYQRLKDFREKLRSLGLFASYDSADQLRTRLSRDLLSTVRNLSRANGDAPSGSVVNLSSLPDLELQRFQSAYETFTRRLNAEWSAERDSGTHTVNEGKEILRRAHHLMLDFRSEPVAVAFPDLAETMDSFLRELRSLQQHQIYMDGGRSFREFWQSGTELIKRITDEIPVNLAQIQANGSS